MQREHLIPFHIRSLCTSWALRGLSAAGVKTVTHSLPGGGRMILPTNDRMASRILCEGGFEPNVRREIERVASRSVNVIDIGANLGYYTILTAQLIGLGKRVYAFEPQSRVVDRLRVNIESSGLMNVTVFPLALSDTAGSIPFHIPTEGAEVHGSIHANGSFEVMKVVNVETQRLDDVLYKLGNPEIGLVKIDAEGAELSILRGATRLLSGPHRPVLIFEAREDHSRPFGYCIYDLLQYVRSFGYRLRQLDNADWFADPEPSLS